MLRLRLRVVCAISLFAISCIFVIETVWYQKTLTAKFGYWHPIEVKLSEASDSEVFDVLKHRLDLVKKYCNSSGHPSSQLKWTVWNHQAPSWAKCFRVAEKLKIMACLIPKAGNTNIRVHLARLMSASDASNVSFDYDRRQAAQVFKYNIENAAVVEQDIDKLLSYDRSQARQMWNIFKKLVVVRHPAHRLISAWQDKFQRRSPHHNNNVSHHETAFEILKRYRPNEPLTPESNVTFDEFARFIYETDKPLSLNIHYKPQWLQASVCDIDYDYIGQLERSASEWVVMLRHATGQLQGAFKPLAEPSVTSNKTRQNVILQRATKDGYFAKALRKHYMNDFLMFGYDLPDFLKE